MSNAIHDLPMLETVLRTDFLSFVEKCFYTLYPMKMYLPNYHIEAIAVVLENIRNGDPNSKVVFNLPPRHLKSELIIVMHTAWRVGHNPTLKTMVLSYSNILVRRHIRFIRQILESDWYGRVFPNTRINGKNSETLIELKGGGSIYGQPIHGQITGLGADEIKIDDPHKVGYQLTPTSIQKDIDWFRETLMSRMEKASKAAVYVVMQRSRPNDLSGFLTGKFGYRHYVFPAYATKDEKIELFDGKTHHRKKGDVLHSDYTSREDFEVQKESMGPKHFEAQYQQNPTYDGGTIFRPEYFGRTTELLRHHNYDTIFQSWDTASSTSPDAAYSVCLTFGMRNDKAHLLNIFRKQLEYTRLVRAAHKLIDAFAPNCVFIEKASTGIALGQELREEYGSAIYSRQPRTSKVERAESVLHIVSKQKFVLVEGIEGLDAFEQEIYSFTGGDHEPSDQVDALTLAAAGGFETRLPWCDGIYYKRTPSFSGFPTNE